MTANVDPQEIAKFAASASRWWDLDGEFKPLHQLNPVRLRYVEQCAGGLFAKRVADIGCGGGLLAEAMARRGASVLGIDLADKPLKVAQLHALEAEVRNLDYRLVAAEALAAEQPSSFDLVTCMEMLEHVPDPAAIVAACAALARPGAYLFFSTIHRSPKAFLYAIVGAEHLLKLLPKGTHEYAKFIRPSELSRWCRDAGMEVVQARGIEYNPLTRRYSLTSDTSVNYLLACRMPAR